MSYIILVFILVLLDQISKYIVDKNFFEGDTIGVLTDFFHLTYVKNRGIAFGMFQGKLDIISIATVIAIGWSNRKYDRQDMERICHRYDRL